jgi:hypothetical protein
LEKASESEEERINGWWKSVARGRERVADEIFFFNLQAATSRVEVRETLLSRRNRKGWGVDQRRER